MPANFWTRYVVAVVIVVVLLMTLYALARALRRHAKMPSDKTRLQALDSIALSPHASVCIVEASDRRFVVGVSGNGVSLIAELHDEAPPEPNFFKYSNPKRETPR